MTDQNSDAVFAGSVPDAYERFLVPLIFESYADDLATRVAQSSPRSVLEVAAGTGVLTRALSTTLDVDVRITATDLNPGMIERARAVGTSRAVRWEQADVMRLPFDDGSFDAVACQFSAMFFPDRPSAYAEINRVLRDRGTFAFNVWDRIATNEFADTVTSALGELFPEDPPMFLARTPHGYHDEVTIRADLASAGFNEPATIEALERRSRAASADLPAIAYCRGTPLNDELRSRTEHSVDDATAHVTRRLTERFGAADLDSKIRGLVITATSP